MAPEPVIILLQTTIPKTEDDWSITRFSMLGAPLREQRDDRGNALYEVTMRDRDEPGKPDSVLSTTDVSGFDQLWLFAVDEGNGLAAEDCEAISRFSKSGRGLLVSRNHMDVGSSVCTLGGSGKAQHFHRTNPDRHGPGLIDSTFHHFADYNWDTQMGCPSFVDEPPGDGAGRTFEGLADTRQCALNIDGWLSAGLGDRRC